MTDLLALDHDLLRLLHAGSAPPWLVFAIVIVTSLGSGWILLALLPALALAKLRARAIFLLSAVLGTGLVVHLLKFAFARVRPCQAHAWAHAVYVSAPSSPSFPSGHAAGSFAFSAFLFTLDKRTGTLALLVAALIGASRIALGVHYPSDVFVGALLGSLIGGATGLVGKSSGFSLRPGSRLHRPRSLEGAHPSPPGRCPQGIPARRGSHDRA